MNIADPTICQWSPAPYLIFSDNIWGNFIYYSHLFPSITALIIAIFVFKQNPRGRVNQALLLLATVFTAWCLIDLVLWATDRSDLIMFFWSILIHFDLLIYIASFYFIYTFICDRWPSWHYELFFLILIIPLVLFAHTPLNLIAFDFTNCWREALEGPLWQYYVYNAELVIAAMILVFSIMQFRATKDTVKRTEITYATAGILLFLVSFSFGNITGSLETDWELGQYGLFGMPIFVGFLTYLIVRFKSFDAKLIASEALVTGLMVLILSMMFVTKIENLRNIAIFTLIVTAVLGFLLTRSVRREINQREEIETLARSLEKANLRLQALDKTKSEFLSIASHQLRSPLTAIRGYSSMMMEGSFGEFPVKARQALERIDESSKLMADSIEDYLNVSRIESGNMKYSMQDFNLRDRVEKVVDELRPVATKAGLLLTFQSDVSSNCIVHADVGKVQQSLHNLINNAIKYTPKGSIAVRLKEHMADKRIWVEIEDTGVGMSEHTMNKLFEKFSRAENASSFNISGTGLGLFVAKNMIEHMGGTVCAKSEGEGKGSTFILELPLQQ